MKNQNESNVVATLITLTLFVDLVALKVFSNLEFSMVLGFCLVLFLHFLPGKHSTLSVSILLISIAIAIHSFQMLLV